MSNRSLRGLRVLNTRPRDQAHELSQNIKAAGGIAIELPSLAIKATDTNWINLLPDLKQVEYAIFISANAAYYCFTQLNQLDIKWPPSIKIVTIGRSTAASLHKFGIKVSSIPDVPDSEHLLALTQLQRLEHQNVLLFKGEGGRPLIEKSLLKRGANLFIFNVYQRVMPQVDRRFISSIWRDDLVDIILLTSEQSLHNLFKLFDEESLDWLRNKSWLIISERLAEIASSLGIQKIKVTHPNHVMDALFDWSC